MKVYTGYSGDELWKKPTIAMSRLWQEAHPERAGGRVSATGVWDWYHNVYLQPAPTPAPTPNMPGYGSLADWLKLKHGEDYRDPYGRLNPPTPPTPVPWDYTRFEPTPTPTPNPWAPTPTPEPRTLFLLPPTRPVEPTPPQPPQPNIPTPKPDYPTPGRPKFTNPFAWRKSKKLWW